MLFCNAGDRGEVGVGWGRRGWGDHVPVFVEWGVLIYACAWADRCTGVEGLAPAWA
jgi:hypothetical protein